MSTATITPTPRAWCVCGSRMHTPDWSHVSPRTDPLRATVAEETQARIAGRQAYDEGAPAAPGVNRWIIRLVGDTEVGNRRTLDLFRAFSAAYQECCDVAAELAIGRPVCSSCAALARGGVEPDMGDDDLTFAPGECAVCRADGIVWTVAE